MRNLEAEPGRSGFADEGGEGVGLDDNPALLTSDWLIEATPTSCALWRNFTLGEVESSLPPCPSSLADLGKEDLLLSPVVLCSGYLSFLPPISCEAFRGPER